ncbi:DNA-binding protein Bv3F [Burkholderia diffusa]|uniref:H-NS histone family protein n=1 Tax=Burkholderia diffusa TaxID=488732 RepID=UPI001CB4FEEC|nr:H-NS histone family protein [Burkholderia diffusa]CAG9252413.1 DNA-binding protein Bv3F [Burkholderia diffusa]
MATYLELSKKRSALLNELEVARRTEAKAAIASIRELVDLYELTEHDIFPPRRGRPKKPVPLPPKYRDPKTGATWSGRGRSPAWLAGKKRERFLIAD